MDLELVLCFLFAPAFLISFWFFAFIQSYKYLEVKYNRYTTYVIAIKISHICHHN